MSDAEWRHLGVIQSNGWEHYTIHRPEPHILLFRRPLGTVSPSLAFALLISSHLFSSLLALSLGLTDLFFTESCYWTG